MIGRVGLNCKQQKTQSSKKQRTNKSQTKPKTQSLGIGCFLVNSPWRPKFQTLAFVFLEHPKVWFLDFGRLQSLDLGIVGPFHSLVVWMFGRV